MPRIRQKADVYRNEDFRRDVKVQMAYYGLSQKETAQQIGIGNSRMSELLHSPEQISVERLRKMIALLKLSPESVLRLLGYQTKDIRDVTVA